MFRKALRFGTCKNIEQDTNDAEPDSEYLLACPFKVIHSRFSSKSTRHNVTEEQKVKYVSIFACGVQFLSMKRYAEKVMQIALGAIQWLGGNSDTNQYSASRVPCDAELYEIGAKISEISRKLIARKPFNETACI